jgi:hypothetical protein
LLPGSRSAELPMNAAQDASARATLREALHFVRHHGENEDPLLLPLLAQHAAAIFQRTQASHERIHDALIALTNTNGRFRSTGTMCVTHALVWVKAMIRSAVRSMRRSPSSRPGVHVRST